MGGRAKVAAKRVADITSIGSIEELVELSRDAEKGKAFLDKLNKLRDELSEVVTAIAKLDEIDGLLIRAKDNNKMSEETLTDAERKAARIISDAAKENTDAIKAQEKAKKEADTAQKKLEQSESAFDKKMVIDNAALDKRESGLNNLKGELDNCQAGLDATAREFKEKAEKARTFAQALS